jgi:hypothetical protein
MGCETIIQVFFSMLLNIKLYHWETMMFSRHKASDELHSSLSDLIDKFIEVYIGRYTRPKFKSSFDIKVKQLNDSNIVEVLHEYIKFLKHDISKYIKDSDTDLLNIRDEILGEFNKTLYLFTLN